MALKRTTVLLTLARGAAFSPSWAGPILSTWLGPCYTDGFSEKSLRQVESLHWGIRRDGDKVTRITAAEQTAIDEDLRERFLGLLEQVAEDDTLYVNEAFKSESPQDVLALIILCDQFSRNIYRKQPEAFRMDPRTAEWSLRLLDEGRLDKLHPIEAIFALLPLEHSEVPHYHDVCLEAFQHLEDRSRKFPAYVQKQIMGSKKFAVEHSEVVYKFGRYPHRNAVLGRQSTPEEIAFLDDGGATWGQ